MRQALIIGFGSIGQRHAQILAALGYHVSVVSRRAPMPGPFDWFASLDAALESRAFDYAVVATETAAHLSAITALASSHHRAPVLVEKPFLAQPHVWLAKPDMPVYVGYQLRFHPAVRALREAMAGDDCIAADFYVGQHLDQWRSHRDSRETYSSHAALGGGVLRDLSHELDLAAWLLGDCERVTALGGRLSELTVDSDDVWGILGQYQRCPVVTLQLNYLDRIGQRAITIVTRNRTLRADLIAGTLTADGTSMRYECGRDEPIAAMHRAITENDGEDVCAAAEGLRVVNVIDAVERAARDKTWVRP